MRPVGPFNCLRGSDSPETEIAPPNYCVLFAASCHVFGRNLPFDSGAHSLSSTGGLVLSPLVRRGLSALHDKAHRCSGRTPARLPSRPPLQRRSIAAPGDVSRSTADRAHQPADDGAHPRGDVRSWWKDHDSEHRRRPAIATPLAPGRESDRWVIHRFGAVEFTWRWDVDVGGPRGQFLVRHGPRPIRPWSDADRCARSPSVAEHRSCLCMAVPQSGTASVASSSPPIRAEVSSSLTPAHGPQGIGQRIRPHMRTSHWDPCSSAWDGTNPRQGDAPAQSLAQALRWSAVAARRPGVSGNP
jgi:hypothetical protein